MDVVSDRDIIPLELHPLGTLRILSDEEDSVNHLSQLLASHNLPSRGYRSPEELFSETTDGAEAPICVLIDWQLEPHDGLALAIRCRENWPATAVIIILDVGTIEKVVTAMRQGLDGVLHKPISYIELIAEIHAAQGRASRRSSTTNETSSASLLIHKLKPCELKILTLLALGIPNKNIAVRLSMSVRTIEKYRHSMFEGLGVCSAAEATRLLVLSRLGE